MGGLAGAATESVAVADAPSAFARRSGGGPTASVVGGAVAGIGGHDAHAASRGVAASSSGVDGRGSDGGRRGGRGGCRNRRPCAGTADGDRGNGDRGGSGGGDCGGGGDSGGGGGGDSGGDGGGRRAGALGAAAAQAPPLPEPGRLGFLRHWVVAQAGALDISVPRPLPASLSPPRLRSGGWALMQRLWIHSVGYGRLAGGRGC